MIKLKVDAIKDGTVIDHISAGKGLEVVKIINPAQTDILLIACNLNSGKIGKKDIIKIENKRLSQKEIDSIALISPNATLVEIADYKVVSKRKMQMPGYVENLIKCPNPKCISNIENINSKFYINKNKENALKCHYCEKEYKVEDVDIVV